MKPHESHHLTAEHEQPDQWHRHSVVEGTPQAEHAAVASPKVLAISFFAMTFTIASSVLILVIFFEHYATNYKAEQIETISRSTHFNDYKGRWEQVESKSYGWADPKAGTVRIPLDTAMERVIAKYKQTTALKPPE
jgi:hypothetical protein